MQHSNRTASAAKRKFIKKYALYLGRWQMSTIILAPCIALLSDWGPIWAAVIGNLIGGAAFFWVDRLIFKEK